jgi:5-formyltetrahydrofolate cyclo-ligase
MWPINDYLIKEKSLFLPRHENGTLSIYEVESKEELITSSFGLHEPDPTLCRKIDPEEISLILVPALYFDVLHHRLGYGKGLFDKFLSSFIKIPKWGIGFKEQKIEKIPNEDHDIQLDNVFLF